MKQSFSYKKIFLTVCVATLCAICMLFCCACEKDEIVAVSVNGNSEIEIGNFEYSDYTLEVKYASGKVESLPLTSDMLSPSENVKFFSQGTQTLTVNYNGATCNFTVEVKLYKFTDLKFDNVEATYTGEPIVAEVFNNYPDGTEVYYPNGNKFTNAGTYQVKAIVSRKNYVTEELTATVVIQKAEYDMSQVVFDNQSFDYNGREHSIVVSGRLPSGVKVDYPDNNNVKIDAGTYTVTANFSGDEANYNLIPSKTATLTINKKKHDTTGLTFNDKTITYDGQEHCVEVQNCPSGVTVTYTTSYMSYVMGEDGKNHYEAVVEEGNIKKTDVGEYIYTANFTSNDKNYEDIRSTSAILTINYADYDTSNIFLTGDEVIYDGQPHSLHFEYNGKEGLPDDVQFVEEFAYYVKDGKIVYKTEDGADGNNKVYATEVTDYGTYIYTATLVPTDNNYKIYDPFTANLIISKATYDESQVSLKEDSFVYDSSKSVSVSVINLPQDVDGNTLGYKLYYFNEQPSYVDSDSQAEDDNLTTKNELPYNNYLVDDQGNPVTSVQNVGSYWVMIEFTNQTNENYEYLQPIVKTFVITENETSNK